MTFSQRLAALDTDAQRAAVCLRFAEDMRYAYDQGKAEAIEAQKVRFRRLHRGREPIGYDLIDCQTNGDAVWSKSPTCKSILSDQQMYERWANLYNIHATRKASEGSFA